MFKIHVGMIGDGKNGDTKWDVPKGEIELTEINNGSYCCWFSIPHGQPPIPIYRKLSSDKFSDVSIEWWARDEDDDTNGEGYYLT